MNKYYVFNLTGNVIVIFFLVESLALARCQSEQGQHPENSYMVIAAASEADLWIAVGML